MYCRHCGKENLDDSIFCEHCGKQLKSPQSAADRLHRLSRHTAQSGVGAEQKKVERPVSLPKKGQRNIQFRGKGRTLVIVVAVILCAALLAFLVSGLETGSLGAKTTRICIMDGRKMTSANYTGDSAGALTISYEIFDINEDGLPSAKYSVTPSAARSGETIVYRYDYDHLVMEYLDYAQRESELTKNEKRRADEVTYYFDYPVLHSEEEAHKRINEAVYQKAEAFMTEMTQEQIETPVMSVFNTPTDCIYTMETQVCHNGEGILSLLYTSNYYMGGNHSIKDREAVTYSLRTGEAVDLTQLTDMDEATLLKELQTRAYTGLEEEAGPMLITDAKGVLERYTLDDFDFIIDEGEIVLLFRTYEFTAGAAGPQYLKTGLYIK